MTRTRTLILSLLLLSVTGCGFSLRGSDALSANYSAMQLYSEQPNSEFSRQLRRSLEDADLELSLVELADADSSIPLLGISAEQLTSRPVTINSRARAAQIELRLSLVIGLQQGEEVLIAPETLFVERTYFQDIENISGNQEEAEIIATEMRRELINQLLRRLSSVQTT